MAEKSLVNVMHQWTLALPMGKSKVTDSDSFHFIKIKVSGWNFFFENRENGFEPGANAKLWICHLF